MSFETSNNIISIDKNIDNSKIIETETIQIKNKNKTSKANKEKSSEQNSEPILQTLYLIDNEFFVFISQLEINKAKHNVSNFDMEKYQIKFGNIPYKKGKLNFPINFELMENEKYNNIKNILKDKIQDLIYKIGVIEIKKDFCLIPKKNNFNNENKNLIYLYSKKKEEGKEKHSYEPISIIECKNLDINEKDKIIELLTEINKNKEIINNPKILKNDFLINCYAIKNKNNNNKTFKGSSSGILEQNKDSDDNQNQIQIPKHGKQDLDFYLMLAIEFIKEINSFKRIIKSSFTYDKNIERKKYYLINKSYINEIYKIFYLDAIKEIMKTNKGKDDKEMLDIIKKIYPLIKKYKWVN